jgi:ArsR family transcriptional regulator
MPKHGALGGTQLEMMKMKDFTRVMKALSDKTRITIIKMLQSRTLCVCELVDVLQVSQPTVSKHLRILEDAGLVGSKKQGMWTNFFLAADQRNPYAEHLLRKLHNWLEEEPRIIDAKRKSAKVDREELCRLKPKAGTSV